MDDKLLLAAHLGSAKLLAVSLAGYSLHLSRFADVIRHDVTGQIESAHSVWGSALRIGTAMVMIGTGLYSIQKTTLFSDIGLWRWLDLAVVILVSMVFWRLTVIGRLIQMPSALRLDRPYHRCLRGLRLMSVSVIFLAATILTFTMFE